MNIDKIMNLIGRAICFIGGLFIFLFSYLAIFGCIWYQIPFQGREWGYLTLGSMIIIGLTIISLGRKWREELK